MGQNQSVGETTPSAIVVEAPSFTYYARDHTRLFGNELLAFLKDYLEFEVQKTEGEVSRAALREKWVKSMRRWVANEKKAILSKGKDENHALSRLVAGGDALRLASMQQDEDLVMRLVTRALFQIGDDDLSGYISLKEFEKMLTVLSKFQDDADDE